MKKILLSLGTSLVATVPVISTISCSSEKTYITVEPEYAKDITEEASTTNLSIWEEIKSTIKDKINKHFIKKEEKNQFGVGGQKMVIDFSAKNEDYIIVSAFVSNSEDYKVKQIDFGNILFLKFEKGFKTSTFVEKIIEQAAIDTNWNNQE